MESGNDKRLLYELFFWILILLSLVVIYAFCELFARYVIVKGRESQVLSLYQTDTLIAQSLKPDSESTLTNNIGEFSILVKTTSQGFRDTEVYQIPKPPDTFRILMLGDSFTLGHGVNIQETFSKVLERSLNERYAGTGEHFEVMNAGYASGFTWDEYYLWLKERGLKYQPDLVIVNAYAGNDLTEIENHAYPSVDDQELPTRIISKNTFVDSNGFLETKATTEDGRWSGYVRSIKSACYASVFCKIAIWPFLHNLYHGILGIIDPQPPAPSHYYDFLKENLPIDTSADWESGKTMLLAANAVAHDARARFMIDNIPMKEEVYDPNGILKDTKIDTTRIESFARENSIPYCSPIALLSQASSTSYFAFDAHLTIRGQELTAQAIQNCILPLLPKKNP